MIEFCETVEIGAILQVIDKRLDRIERAVANPMPESIDPGHAYTRRQAATALGASTWTIDKARKEGLLIEARHIGKRDVRVTGESLVRFLRERESALVHVRKL